MPTTQQTDLWPTDLFGEPTAATPVAILRQQGEALGARTHNFVLGEVETGSNSQGTIFEHWLMLVAPFLRYRKPLLLVTHGLQPYPVDLTDTDLTRSGEPWHRKVENEEELRDRLREFFNRERVKAVIRAVSNMSNDIASPDNGRG